MADYVSKLTEVVARRVEQRLIAALELPDEEHRCPECNGEGYVLDVWPNERQCEACGGTGLRAEQE